MNFIKRHSRLLMAAVVFLLSLAMCFYGGLRGEMEIVFTKAVNICLECIGLG